MSVRRVGTITCGCMLILFGALFIVHMFVPMVDFAFILKAWPCILIALGIEMLISCRKSEEGVHLKYDGAAVFITLLLLCFAMGMGVMEQIVECFSAEWVLDRMYY